MLDLATLFLYFTYLFINLIPKIIIQKFRLFIFLFIFSLIFLLKNFIISGCLIYPIPFTCFDDSVASWSTPKHNVESRYYYESSVSKGWIKYLQTEFNKNQYTYNEINKKNDFLYPKKYLDKNLFFRLKYWLLGEDLIKLSKTFLILSLLTLLIFLINIKTFKFK